MLTGSRWAAALVEAPGQAVRSAVVRLLGTTEVEVEPMTGNGLRRFDARPAITTLELSTPSPANRAQPEPVVLVMTLAHTTPAVRPDDVLAALVAVSPDAVLEALAHPARSGRARPGNRVAGRAGRLPVAPFGVDGRGGPVWDTGAGQTCLTLGLDESATR